MKEIALYYTIFMDSQRFVQKDKYIFNIVSTIST